MLQAADCQRIKQRDFPWPGRKDSRCSRWQGSSRTSEDGRTQARRFMHCSELPCNESCIETEPIISLGRLGALLCFAFSLVKIVRPVWADRRRRWNKTMLAVVSGAAPQSIRIQKGRQNNTRALISPEPRQRLRGRVLDASSKPSAASYECSNKKNKQINKLYTEICICNGRLILKEKKSIYGGCNPQIIFYISIIENQEYSWNIKGCLI